MYRIINARHYAGGRETAADYIHAQWGDENNRAFYRDAVAHSFDGGRKFPRFYLLLAGEQIAGCHALLMDDFVSRQDLWPWLGCLFVEPTHRGKGLSRRIFDHAQKEVRDAGIDTLYLTTGHEGLYEKYGWERIEDGYGLFGERVRVYQLPTHKRFRPMWS